MSNYICDCGRHYGSETALYQCQASGHAGAAYEEAYQVYWKGRYDVLKAERDALRAAIEAAATVSDRITMTIKMQLTPAQALAMQTALEHMNRLASWGSSRFVAYFADGDGNFKPQCEWEYSEQIPELTDEMRQACAKLPADDGDRDARLKSGVYIDFDPIAWMLHK